MVAQLINFDPVSYLNIDSSSLSEWESKELRQSLMDKIGEYIILKSTLYLSGEQLNQIKEMRGQQLLSTLENIIPDFDKKVLTEIENFKKDYQMIKG